MGETTRKGLLTGVLGAMLAGVSGLWSFKRGGTVQCLDRQAEALRGQRDALIEANRWADEAIRCLNASCAYATDALTERDRCCAILENYRDYVIGDRDERYSIIATAIEGCMNTIRNDRDSLASAPRLGMLSHPKMPEGIDPNEVILRTHLHNAERNLTCLREQHRQLSGIYAQRFDSVLWRRLEGTCVERVVHLKRLLRKAV